jgi:hypothetical protein
MRPSTEGFANLNGRKMEAANQSVPPDGGLIRHLLIAADQFEEAACSGRNLVAAGAAHKIVAIFKRFFNESFQSSINEDTQANPPQFLSFAVSNPVSSPDPDYVETVHSSMRKFKTDVKSGNMAAALRAIKPTGILKDVTPAQELEQLQTDAARIGGYRRLALLPRMAKLAMWLNQPDKAEEYASEALKLIRPQRADDPFDEGGDAIHDVNMVAGLLALRRGDLGGAKQFLLASAETRGSRALRMLGPNLTLAHELLKQGERDVVVQYLERIRAFWMGVKALDIWVKQIRNGEMPDFGLYLTT